MNHTTPSWIARLLAGAELQQSSLALDRALDQAQQQAAACAAAEAARADTEAMLAGFTLIPGHVLLRVTQIGPELRFAFAERDWLEKFLKEHPSALAHHRESASDVIFLTAPTADLQKFVREHLADGELFGKAGVSTNWSRRPAPAAPQKADAPPTPAAPPAPEKPATPNAK